MQLIQQIPTMVEQILIFVVTLVSFLLGYYLGKGEKVNIPGYIEEVKHKVSMSQVKPGPIMRPNLKQIDRRQNKSLYEGIDEVKKAFSELGVKDGQSTES